MRCDLGSVTDHGWHGSEEGFDANEGEGVLCWVQLGTESTGDIVPEGRAVNLVKMRGCSMKRGCSR